MAGSTDRCGSPGAPPPLSLSLCLSLYLTLHLLCRDLSSSPRIAQHTLPGIVSSGVMTTLMQVYSRVFIVWAIVELTPGVAENLGLLIVCYAWGITEVSRYSYYFFALVDAVPYIIKWCRYVPRSLLLVYVGLDTGRKGALARSSVQLSSLPTSCQGNGSVVAKLTGCKQT